MSKQPQQIMKVQTIDEQTQLIEFECINNTIYDQPIVFKGTLSSPISCTSLNVVRFNIPNNKVPLMINFNNTKYQFSMSYNGHTVSRYITLDVRNAKNLTIVPDVDTLVVSMNTCLTALVAQLGAVVTLPPNVSIPYIYYNNHDGLFNFVVQSDLFNTSSVIPISIYCNNALHDILDTLPCVDTSVTPKQDTARYQFIFRTTPETTYNTTWTKIEQESCTLALYASAKKLQITSEGTPINTMTQLRNVYGTDVVSTSAPASYPIVQNYSFNYNNGSISLKTNNDYYIVTNKFRDTYAGLLNTTYFNFSVQFTCSDGTFYPMTISPGSSANMVIQLNNVF